MIMIPLPMPAINARIQSNPILSLLPLCTNTDGDSLLGVTAPAPLLPIELAAAAGLPVVPSTCITSSRLRSDDRPTRGVWLLKDPRIGVVAVRAVWEGLLRPAAVGCCDLTSSSIMPCSAVCSTLSWLWYSIKRLCCCGNAALSRDSASREPAGAVV